MQSDLHDYSIVSVITQSGGWHFALMKGTVSGIGISSNRGVGDNYENRMTAADDMEQIATK